MRGSEELENHRIRESENQQIKNLGYQNQGIRDSENHKIIKLGDQIIRGSGNEPERGTG